jgi:hypothetical protein
MEALIGVSWTDSTGTNLVDATTFSGLSNIIHAIQKERGKVLGVRFLEQL